MSSTFSPSRSPGSSRLQQLGAVSGVSRLRSSSLKKPPEPLRRAVADCLSSSAANLHHGGPSASVVVAEASRTLRVSNFKLSGVYFVWILQLCLDYSRICLSWFVFVLNFTLRLTWAACIELNFSPGWRLGFITLAGFLWTGIFVSFLWLNWADMQSCIWVFVSFVF